MTRFLRLLVAVLSLFAAIACYGLGAPSGGVIFLAFGMMFEGYFWYQVLRKTKG